MSNSSYTLSLTDAIFLIIGIIVGVGIFEATPAIANASGSEFNLYLVWVIGALASLAGACCYAELAGMFPKQGGDVVYLNQAFGKWLGFLFAWSRTVIIRPGSIAAMAFPFATYFTQVFETCPLSNINLAIISVVVLTLTNLLGLRSGTLTQNLLSIAKLLGLFIIILVGIFMSLSDSTVLESNLPNTSTDFGLALILVLFCFGGWNEITFIANRVRNPQQLVPRSMILGTSLVTLLYLGLTFSFISTLGLTGTSASEAVATDVMSVTVGGGSEIFVSLLIAISALGAINGLIITGARISATLGEECSTLQFLSKADDKDTPATALVIQGIISILIILATGSFTSTLVYTTAVVWIFYLASGVSLFVFRRKKSDLPRPYKVAFYPITPIIFCISCFYLIYSALCYDFFGSVIAMLITLSGMLFYYYD